MVCLALSKASVARAASKEELLEKYPTLEAAAHHFGAVDIGFAVDHHVIAWVSYPGVPEQATGMLERLRAIRDVDPIGFTLIYVLVQRGQTLDDLEGRVCPRLIVKQGGDVVLSKAGADYRVGTVNDELDVKFLKQLNRIFEGNHTYIPALDRIFHSPWTLPRSPFARVASRRILTRKGVGIFLTPSGADIKLELDICRCDSERRLLVAKHKSMTLVLGEIFAFGAPEGWGSERALYLAEPTPNRKLEFALFNEIGPIERLERPIQPEYLTVVYGVKIYDDYLDSYDQEWGPVLRFFEEPPKARPDHES